MSDADRTGARRQSQSGNPSGNPIGNPIGNPCQACGACCGYSSNWPRFTIEDDAALDLIPAELVNARLSGMRCDGDRCAALRGEIGVETACTIYAIRPDVCRTCMPGDAECAMARRKYGLPTLTLTVVPAESRDSAA